jgi:rare lipoprotein A (peptidoglycan hydrolase)
VKRSRFGLVLLSSVGLFACTTAQPPNTGPLTEPLAARPAATAGELACAPSFSQFGTASWYGAAFHLRQTASGEPFDMNDLTAAHRFLPLNTVVRVTNLHNGKSVVVRINDRGPYVRGRTIDLSSYAAKQLGMRNSGLAPVRIDVFDLDRREISVAQVRTAELLAQSGSSTPPSAWPKHFPQVGALVEEP